MEECSKKRMEWNLWALKELKSNRHDLCTPPPLESSIYCLSQPHGDTTTHINSILLFKLIHPLKVSRPLSHFGHVGMIDRVWRRDAVQAWLPISHNPTLVAHHPLCEIPLDMPIAMQSLGPKQRRTTRLNAAQIPHMCLDLIYRWKCVKDDKHGCLSSFSLTFQE